MKKTDTPAVKTPKVVPNPGRINEEPQPVGAATSGEVNELPEAPPK